MNKQMVKTLKKVDLFGQFAKYGGVAPKSLADLEWFKEECIKSGNIETAELITEWKMMLEYYIRREHDDSDNFYL